jgi:hypothetical protein
VEALHDMSRPVDVLATVRRLLAPGGTLIVADERVADAFHAPARQGPHRRTFLSSSALTLRASVELFQRNYKMRDLTRYQTA